MGAKRNGPLQFEFPVFIMVHPNGKVLVSERDSNCTQVLNQDLAFSRSLTTRGSPRGIVYGYFGMAVDSQGVIYATDRCYGCVQKFSISGQSNGHFGNLGFRKGSLNYQYGIAVDDKDYMYISEQYVQRISIFTSKGNLSDTSMCLVKIKS